MIKKLLLTFSFLTVSLIFAQKNNNQQAVADASEKLRLAMISGDKTILESLILPELTYGHSGGHIDDAKEFVEKLASKKSNFLVFILRLIFLVIIPDLLLLFLLLLVLTPILVVILLKTLAQNFLLKRN